MTVLIECFQLQTETYVNVIQNMKQNETNWRGERGEEVIRFVDNSHVYQSPKNNCLLLLVQFGHTKYRSIYKYIYFNFFEDYSCKIIVVQ